MVISEARGSRLVKGALIELAEAFLGPVPSVIAFQYNPETVTRSLSTWQPPKASAAQQSAEAPCTAQPEEPVETLTLSLELDATDALEQGDPVAAASGIADRLAALEMLAFPTAGPHSVLGDVLGGSSMSAGTAERKAVPIVLLVWGPGRVLPVRITSFQVEEQLFSAQLYPIRAKVSLGLQVLRPQDLEKLTDNTTSRDLAIAAYKWTRGQKEVLARLALVKTAAAIPGILPF